MRCLLSTACPQNFLIVFKCRWNPAVEQQAQDRIHRLGQFKPIAVTRFIIGGTIEERILKLQVIFCTPDPFLCPLCTSEDILLSRPGTWRKIRRPPSI
jgi:hypothetical protein